MKNRCLALFSGGLDSILAVKHMQKLGYEVIPVFFETPFFEADYARKVAQANNFELKVIDVFDDYIQMLVNPRYGYGKNMNPCIDCHGFMFRMAGKMLNEFAAGFIISGEVLGQRPMSQRKDAMNAVGKLSKVKDLIVRPLCQPLLADTLPVREGWVNKDDLLRIQGRGRHEQLRLAKEYNIKEFHNPGGGCKLTDIKFSRRLKDLIEYQQLTKNNVSFLLYGRHFRLNETTKLVVGRHKEDNEQLSLLATDETVLKTNKFQGPLAIIIKDNPPDIDEIQKSAGIVLRYCNAAPNQAEVAYGKNFLLNKFITVEKYPAEDVDRLMIK